MKRIVLAIVAIGMVALLLSVVVACSSTTDIADVPELEGQEVTVEGRVSLPSWFGDVSMGAYELSDDSGTVWVITEQEPPPEGGNVTVTGTVESAFSIGEEQYGVVVMESEREEGNVTEEEGNVTETGNLTL